jgi:hypothetical protein
VWSSDAFEWQAPVERTEWLAHLAYAPGDRLYVREAHGFNHYKYAEGKAPKERPEELPDDHFSYLATECDAEIVNDLRYRPSIHMPRWASRMWLAVTDVRVQRLQEISVTDVRAEGVKLNEPRQFNMFGMDAEERAAHRLLCARLDWEDLWNSLHTAEGERWQDNPWVVAVSFDVHLGNIDAETAA